MTVFVGKSYHGACLVPVRIVTFAILVVGAGLAMFDQRLGAQGTNAPQNETSAEDSPDPKPPSPIPASPPPPATQRSMYNPSRRPDRPRLEILPQIASFILPGFDQWWEGQYIAGAAYSGTATFSVLLASSGSREIQDARDREAKAARESSGGADANEESQNSELDQKGFTERKVMLALQTYQSMGGLSAYHSFRTSVQTRRPGGQYQFLTKEETPRQILQAPFRFDHLLRQSTIWPLAVGATIAVLITKATADGIDSGELKDEIRRSEFTSADGLYAMGFSYNAGTHEEAVFRGWILPVTMEYVGSPFWSNMITATLFAAAHLGSNSRPIPQFLLGYYLGWRTQKNDWTISESIFIHTWWDVIAFATAYQFESVPKSGKTTAEIAPAIFWLPPLSLTF